MRDAGKRLFGRRVPKEYSFRMLSGDGLEIVGLIFMGDGEMGLLGFGIGWL